MDGSGIENHYQRSQEKLRGETKIKKYREIGQAKKVNHAKQTNKQEKARRGSNHGRKKENQTQRLPKALSRSNEKIYTGLLGGKREKKPSVKRIACHIGEERYYKGHRQEKSPTTFRG